MNASRTFFMWFVKGIRGFHSFRIEIINSGPNRTITSIAASWINGETPSDCSNRFFRTSNMVLISWSCLSDKRRPINPMQRMAPAALGSNPSPELQRSSNGHKCSLMTIKPQSFPSQRARRAKFQERLAHPSSEWVSMEQSRFLVINLTLQLLKQFMAKYLAIC